VVPVWYPLHLRSLLELTRFPFGTDSGPRKGQGEFHFGTQEGPGGPGAWGFFSGNHFRTI